MIELIKSTNDMWAVAFDATVAQHAWLRRLMSANHLDDPQYHLRQKCHAFFQCGSAAIKGYVLIEFWTSKLQSIQEFVDYLNENMPKD